MTPKLILGNHFSDKRGVLTFNNNFDIQNVKRVYFIENSDIDLIRGWQGHRIEQRWFSVVLGSFEITLIAVDNWEKPNSNLPKEKFIINALNFQVLHIPSGYITSIQALDKNSKLMAMSDYSIGEIQDEYRYSSDYFNISSIK